MATKGAAKTPRPPTTKRPIQKTPSKKSATPNASILSFFKKVEVEESLFCESSGLPLERGNGIAENIYDLEDNEAEIADERRFNEVESPFKRRKQSEDGNNPGKDSETPLEPVVSAKSRPKRPKRGPFLDDSDSDDPESSEVRVSAFDDSGREAVAKLNSRSPIVHSAISETAVSEPYKAAAAVAEDPVEEDFGDFADVDGFSDDDDLQVQEDREARYMKEQAMFEAAEQNGDVSDSVLAALVEDTKTQCCPICNGSLAGVTADEATVHVNGCLDGNPVPLPTAKKDETPPEPSTRAAKAAVPRPGQANPFDVGPSAGSTASAFAKLMSGHAEDEAWSNAAAAEEASRGKAAYQRTCPFYKIMPGFSICVDAFRYGAVEGCNAYFLSHFHSDHYIGLTASWSHGPIYCSKVTGSLVKSQLRVAEKWVVVLEFEERSEVPGTGGAFVTMIPANHCPGSSLFLLEKPMGKGPNARVQRILHCGDFRACPAHVTHPGLKPNLVDTVTRRVKQQRIDICYLDTTYLNPRYSFPAQEDVIQACAELCASISPDPNSKDDIFDKAKREKGATTVSQFFTAASRGVNSDESDEEEAFAGKGKRAPHEPSTAAPAPPPAAPKQHPLLLRPPPSYHPPRLLVVCGTYSIGKERICKAVALRLGSRVYAGPAKSRIVAQLGDPELTALLTSDPRQAQVHMQPLAELRAETLRDYLDAHRPHFSRVVGLRPTGWNYRPGMTAAASSSGAVTTTTTTTTAAADDKNGANLAAAAASGGGGGATNAAAATANLQPSSLPTTQLLHGVSWRCDGFSARDLAVAAMRTRGNNLNTAAAAPNGGGAVADAVAVPVPYSEHSSFRELALFVMALRIERVVPTVNVGSAPARRRMKAWLDRWIAERRRGGVVSVLDRPGRTPPEQEGGGSVEGKAKEGEDARGHGSEPKVVLWEGKDGKGGGAYW